MNDMRVIWKTSPSCGEVFFFQVILWIKAGCKKCNIDECTK